MPPNSPHEAIRSFTGLVAAPGCRFYLHLLALIKKKLQKLLKRLEHLKYLKLMMEVVALFQNILKLVLICKELKKHVKI